MSKTLEVLHESLLSLSKSDAVHYETVCYEIAKTRFSILKMEGVEIDRVSQAEYVAQEAIKMQYEKDIEKLAMAKARLSKAVAEKYSMIKQLRIDIDDLSSQLRNLQEASE